MDKNKGLILVILTALISGMSIFLNSFAVKGFDSSVFTFSKNIVVAIFLATIIYAFGNFYSIKELTKKQWLKLSLIGLIGGSIPFLLFFKGLQLTSQTSSGFLHKTMFIYVCILAIIFLKEKLNKALLFGVILIACGNYLMIKPSLQFNTGDILILVATLFWAVELIISKHTLKELSGNLVAFGRMFFGSIFILIFLVITGKTSKLISMNTEQYLWIIITSVFLLGYVWTFYNGLKTIKVSTAATILSLGAPITTILAYIFSNKIILVYDFLGIFLIILGVISIVVISENLKIIPNKLSKKYGWN